MKIEETIAKLLAEAKKATVLISEQDKEGSAYAIGMAKAKEITGDKPPLEKETIKKAHDIAKGILKTEETEEEKKKREEEEAKAKAQTSTKTESEATPNADDKKKEDEKEKEIVKETEMTDDEKKKAEDEAKAKADAVKKEELTDKQKTLPPALQKAIKDKEEKESVKEETEEEKAKREAEEKAKAEKEAEVKKESEKSVLKSLDKDGDGDHDLDDHDSEKKDKKEVKSEEDDKDEDDKDKDEDEKEMKSESEEEDDEEKIKEKNAKKPDEVKMNEFKVNVSEDVEALLKGETLSEEFKAKAKIIFENVVINRVKNEVARISNELKVDNAKSIATIKESLIEKVDGYLSYVVEQWVLQNEIALESGIKNEILEEFVNGLRNLFEDHYIEVPNERFDVLTDLQDQLNTAKKKLDEATIENAKNLKAFSDLRKNEIISIASKDLVSTDAEKLKALAEELTFEDDASFEKKIQTIRDNYFSALSATQNPTKQLVDTIVTDEPIVINESAKITDVKIAAYADLLTRSKKQN